MSAPDTNIEKQVQRHYGPLWGIGLAVTAAVAAAFVVPVWAPEDESNAPIEAEALQTERSQ